jgi:phospholipid/cholesterol/gamma-HCH transport system ATP-binding protein
MIYDGRIIWHGAAQDIDRSGNQYVEQFVQGKAEGPIRMPVRPL